MTIEAAYQKTLERTRRVRQPLDQALLSLLSQVRREMAEADAIAALDRMRAATRRRTVEDAVMRMHADDLDAAWNAALRGDVSLALKRVAVHVRTVRRERKGTPWRMTGWLKRQG